MQHKSLSCFTISLTVLLKKKKIAASSVTKSEKTKERLLYWKGLTELNAAGLLHSAGQRGEGIKNGQFREKTKSQINAGGRINIYKNETDAAH